jgi:ABC-type Fe2+-enterobactin transport system substrate-binding protein
MKVKKLIAAAGLALAVTGTVAAVAAPAVASSSASTLGSRWS